MEKMVIANDPFFAEVVRMLGEGKRVRIPVKGYSMLPFIRGEKDEVWLETPGEVKVDDIVLFHYRGRYIMHRVIGRQGERYVIRGDGVPKNCEYPLREEILGKAVSIIRDGEEVDPYSSKELRRVHLWQRLRPLRRYLLFAYWHFPWNRSWLKGE